MQRELWIYASKLNVPRTQILPHLTRKQKACHENWFPGVSQERNLGDLHKSFYVDKADNRALRRELYSLKELMTKVIYFLDSWQLVLNLDLSLPINDPRAAHRKAKDGALVARRHEVIFSKSLSHRLTEQTRIIRSVHAGFESLFDLDHMLLDDHGHSSQRVAKVGPRYCPHRAGHFLDWRPMFGWFVLNLLPSHPWRISIARRAEHFRRLGRDHSGRGCVNLDRLLPTFLLAASFSSLSI